MIKKSVVYIGDEVRDIKTAQQSNIPIIAVTWGFNSKKKLAKSKPDFLATKPEEILNIIHNF